MKACSTLQRNRCLSVLPLQHLSSVHCLLAIQHQQDQVQFRLEHVLAWLMTYDYCAGPIDEQPVNLAYSIGMACPEVTRAECLGGLLYSQEYMDAPAMDTWALGYMLYYFVTDDGHFSRLQGTQEQKWHALQQQHAEWVSCLTCCLGCAYQLSLQLTSRHTCPPDAEM